MLLGFYTILYYTIASLILPKEYFKRPKELRNRWLKEKLAIFPKFQFPEKRKVIWIHAVSVGEVIAISRLVKKLASKYNILLSTITDTGQKVALQKFKDLPVKVIYLPLDCPFAIKRTLKAFNPKSLIIAETEIWPNLICTASKYVPVFLINARLSERSFKNYKKIKFFIKPILNRLTCIAVQEEEYKERFKKLGVAEEKLVVTGNTKFDIEIKELFFPWEGNLIKPVIIAGSTHFPEEELLVKTFVKLESPGTFLVVPRHPERFDEVENTIKEVINGKSEIGFYRVTQLNSEKVSFKDFKKLIILVDKIGILASLYRICDIAIIGGSFIPHGGQNPLEAIYWKKPVLFGPSMENFPFVKEFLEKKACLQTDKNSLITDLQFLIKNERLRKELGERAYHLFSEKRGATEKILDILKIKLTYYYTKFLPS